MNSSAEPRGHAPAELGRPQGSIVPHLLLFGVQMFGMSAPPFPYRRQIFSLLIAFFAIYAGLNQFTNDPGLAQVFSLAWPHYLCILANFLYTDYPGPEAALWRIDKPRQEALQMQPLSLKKLKWGWVIWFNLRGIRWNFQVKNVPRGLGPEVGKWQFLRWQVLRLIKTIVMVDLMSQLAVWAFYTEEQRFLAYTKDGLRTCRHQDPLKSFIGTAIFGIGPYFFMNVQYVAGSVLWVLFGFSKPQDWPPFFGHVSDVTTVRYFWGNFWHQMLRRTANLYTGWLVRVLNIKKGTNWSSYVQLWGAFLISGTMHAFAILQMPPVKGLHLQDLTLGWLCFFLSQAAAITLEDFVLYLWKQAFGEHPATPSLLRRLVGYIWVTCWFWFSLPFALDMLLRFQVGKDPILPFTFTRPLIERFLGW